MKKILVIGIIALVVIGCVVAAGCTTTTTSTDSKTVNGVTTTTTTVNGQTTTVTFTSDDLVGTWTENEANPSDNKLAKFLVNSDKTGVRYIYDNTGKQLDEVPFTWEPSAQGMVIVIKGTDGKDVTIKATLSADKKSLIDVNGVKLIKS